MQKTKRISILLKPYHMVMKHRRACYQSGWIPSTRFPCPVISVGNLAWGGTGKSPLVATLAETLAYRRCNPVIVTRGYGRVEKHPGPLLVTSEHIQKLDADTVGDESLEYGLDSFRWSRLQNHTGVVVASDREAGVRFALDELRAGSIILDDGFQHLAIQRNVDLLVLDATNPWASGLLRESRNMVAQAQYVVLSRTDIADAKTIENLLPELHDLGYTGPILRGYHHLSAILDITQNPYFRYPADSLKSRRVLLVTGIANPDGVARTALFHGVDVVEMMRWRDHHRYYLVDVMRIVSKAKELEVDTILTTRKDAVKLSSFIQQDNRGLNWMAFQILWRWDNGEEIIEKALDACWK